MTVTLGGNPIQINGKFPQQGESAPDFSLVGKDLADVKLSHVWTGQCAGTFDMMPHIGCHDGIWYGMGYNFAGVPMGSFFGLKIAQKILGLPVDASAFESATFSTLPFYRGSPWFLPLAMRYFAWKDARLARSRA